MKHLILAALIAASAPAFAGTTKTDTLIVNGDCGMCEVTIEKAAKLPGVSSAEWDADAKTLVLTYDPEKVKTEDVLRAIATKGYDNEAFTATDASYKALPHCCQYDRKAIAVPRGR